MAHLGEQERPRRASTAMTVMCGVCYVGGLVANAGSLWLGTAWPGVDPRRPMDAYDSEARPP